MPPTGADLNITADDGNTPLHLAVGTRSTQLRKVIILEVSGFSQ